MSLQSKLQQFYTGLAMVNSNCYHYFAPSGARAPYIIWYEDSEDNSLDADNHKVRQAVAGYIDYFTRVEFDTTFDAIQTFLDNFEGITWEWTATQYGDPTHEDDNLIHYTWMWRMR